MIIAYLFLPSMFLIMGYIFIPRMKEFLGNLSVADAMGSLYGCKVEFIAAVAGVIKLPWNMIATQFRIFGTLFNLFFSIDVYMHYY